MRKTFGTVIACAAGLVCNALIFGPVPEHSRTGINDFLAVYAGATAAGSPGLYEPQHILAIQDQTAGWHTDRVIFARLPWVALLFKPFTMLPYREAYYAWELACLAALAAAIALWPFGSLQTRCIAVCWSLPLYVSFQGGQDVPWLLLFLSAAVRFAEVGRPFATGICAVLLSIKVHMVILAGALLVVYGGWYAAFGAAAGGLGLLALSFGAGGLYWMRDYLSLLPFVEAHCNFNAMPNFHGIFLKAPGAEAAAVIAVIAIIVAVAARDRQFGLACALAGGVLTGRHAFLADCALLLPALSLMNQAASDSTNRHVAILFCSPLLLVPTLESAPVVTVVAMTGLFAWMAASVLRMERGPIDSANPAGRRNYGIPDPVVR